MAFRTFSILIIVRTCLFIISLLILTSLLNSPGYHAASIVCFGVLIFIGYDLVKFVNTTNSELSRFLEAAKFADFSQRFEFSEQGSGFEELGATFTAILNKMRDERSEHESNNRYLHSLLEHVPVPLLSIDSAGKVTSWNISARKLFAQSPVHHMDDFAHFGSEMLDQIRTLKPGENRLVSVSIDGSNLRLSLSASEVISSGNRDVLVSLLDIQNELDFAQMQAWQDLVKVLTHEIMNSITPVASLANTSVELLGDIQHKYVSGENIEEDLQELFHGIDTVSRRSDSLINFVASYRKLTELPQIQFSQVDISLLFDVTTTILCQENLDIASSIKKEIQPASLKIFADKDLLEQVIINLLKNAIHATENNRLERSIVLRAYINKSSRGVIEIQDNGSGIEEDVISSIFVPFFTTKRNGSGVGLALTRQVMIAHRGSVSVRNIDQGGACFRLTF